MIRIGILGLLLGALLGLLVAAGFFVLLAWQAVSPIQEQLTTPSADMALFISERSLSRLIAADLQRPLVLNFEPGGQVEVTTPADIAGLEPVVDLGLSLELRGPAVVSQLQWAKIGFLKIPAGWLPDDLVELGAVPGRTITRQLPPEFILVGLATSTDGLTVQLDWKGP